MGEVSVSEEVEDVMEDRFDDQSFDDAPLSDVESNFDEQELTSLDGHADTAQVMNQLRLREKSRTALSTIPEESKIDDIVTNDLPQNSLEHRRSDSLGDSTSDITQDILIRSSDFITDKKASEVIQSAQESFFRSRGRFIPDDPRFNQSHFEKENSWEPSIISVFDISGTDSNGQIFHSPTKGSASSEPSSHQPVSDLESCAKEKSSDNALLSANLQKNGEFSKHEVTVKNLSVNQQQDKKTSMNEIRSTPQRRLAKPLINDTENSPVPSEPSSVGMQTSTPVSVVGKLPSRQRLRDLEEMVSGISVISCEEETAETAKEVASSSVNHSLSESGNTTMLSVGQVQRILKSAPNNSPSTLLRALESQRNNRVRLKKTLSDKPPLPPKDFKDHRPYVSSSSIGKMNSTTSALANRSTGSANAQAVVSCAKSSNSKVVNSPSGIAHATYTVLVPSQSENFKLDPSQQQTSADGCKSASENIPLSAVHDNEVNTRTPSVRSGTSLSTGSGARSDSRMNAGNSRRSVLFIPQLELAFGCIDIGDTATASVDVTNRTDRPLRIRAKLKNPGNVFTLLDSQIILLDAHRTTSLRVEFYATQNARFCTTLSITASGGGIPAVSYKMPVRGLGGVAVLSIKGKEDLRISRNGSYILQSAFETTFSFTLVNSGKRHAFARILVLYYGESSVPEHLPVAILPASGIVIGRDETKQISVRLQSQIPSSDWRSSQNSIISTASATQHAVSPLQVIVYWGEERTRRRLRCFEEKTNAVHLCENLQFTEKYNGEDPDFEPPKDYPISKEDVRLFDECLRMFVVYVCSPRIRPRQSLVSNSSLERSLQPEDTFRERSTYTALIVPDQTMR